MESDIDNLTQKKMDKLKIEFIRFLKNENIYIKFLRNFEKRDNWNSHFKNMDDVFYSCAKHSVKNVIDKSFRWSDTLEGFSFWSDKNNKFKCNFEW